ncbi:signal transduction histidine kinase [Evansella vedderi]|uniref:histidine kinase n=1 Tax=Evansella vedderi TaxID=38282 RepID=A0ABT9ZUH9_9BACI|nr:ATP-binding protein [Evansella vedderi]MDQ0254382.1 signal transduction histidine kinase [Evansella vedderi]
MKEEAIRNDYNILQTVAALSDSWIFVFETDHTLTKTYVSDKEIQETLQYNFFYCLKKDEHKKFRLFFEKVLNSSSLVKEQFTFHINLHKIEVLITATVEDQHVVMIGKPKVDRERYQHDSSIVHQFPVPVLSLTQDGDISNWNCHMERLLKQMDVPDIEKDKQISFNKTSNDFFYKITEIYHSMKETGESKKEMYKSEEMRFILQGLIYDEETFLVVIKDESYQRKFEQLLTYQHQMQAVSQIAAGVAHELRNPLSVIKGFLQLSRLSDNLNKYYETILSEIERMNKIIEDFLSVSRKKIDKHYIQPEELMDSILMIFHSECILHDIELTFNIIDSNSSIYANEQMIKQVLLNVLRNSIEAYEEQKLNRVFVVNTEIYKGFYCIELTDKGPGISREAMEKIEQPFFTTKEKGTGIGIPLCKRIIEEHNGGFYITSEEGMGTTVRIQLPLHKN